RRALALRSRPARSSRPMHDPRLGASIRQSAAQPTSRAREIPSARGARTAPGYRNALLLRAVIRPREPLAQAGAAGTAGLGHWLPAASPESIPKPLASRIQLRFDRPSDSWRVTT